MKKLLVLLVFILVASGVFAEDKYLNTAQFLHDCWLEEKAGHSNWQAGFYVGFVSGVEKMASVGEKWFSIPEGTSNGEILDNVGRYLDDYPKVWSVDSYLAVISILGTVYPPKQ